MTDRNDVPITGSEVATGTRVLAAVARVLRRPEPAAVLRRRAEVREEIRENLRWPDRDEVPEVLIVKHNKYDDDDVDNRLFARGASNWFKAEVKSVADRGLEVYSSIEYVTIRRSKATRVRDDTIPGAQKVWVVGRIAYERITHLDWSGDPSYGAPRFYVVYSPFRRNPYREVVLYENSRSSGHQYEMEGVKYLGERGVLKRTRNFARNIAFSWRQRREMKRARRERYDTRL